MPLVKQFFSNMYLAVEMFFIISGYFLYNEIVKYDFAVFMKKRFLRLFPVYFAVMFLACYLLHNHHYTAVMANIFLLPVMGFEYIQPIVYYGWFMFPLFWVGLFYYCLFKNKNKNVIFITSLLVYFSYVALCTNRNTLNFPVANFLYLFSGAVLRTVGGLGLGLIIAYAQPYVQFNRSKLAKFGYSTVEGLLLLFVLRSLFCMSEANYCLLIVIAFCLLLMLCIQSAGFISQILNKCSFLVCISKYCYCCYLVSWLIIGLLIRYDTSVLQFITKVFLLSILGGIFMYHFVEQPLTTKKSIPVKSA
jgi:peptidoglycan/LPS O-acetylase OafA/YrhL